MFKRLRNGRKGFSLVELIVVIAIMAVLISILAPTLLQHVEKSRAQKDDSAMGEVVEVVKLAMVEQDVYDECLCYTVDGNKAYYVIGADETKWEPGGTMRGLTITFHADKNANATQFRLAGGKVNEFVADGTESFNGTVATGATLGTMTSSTSTGELYNKVKAGIEDGEVKLTSQTYRNSDYTIFIIMGNSNTAVVIYGQWNGTNLPGSGSNNPNNGEDPVCTKNDSCEVTVYEDHLDGCPKKQGGGSVKPKASLDAYTWAELKDLAALHLTAEEYKNTYNLVLGDKKDNKYILVDYDNYGGLVFMYNSGVTAKMNDIVTNKGGYDRSAMRGTVNSIYNNLGDAELKAVIKEVTINCNDGSDAPTAIHPVETHMFLPSVREVSVTRNYGTHSSCTDKNNALTAEGSTFDYFNTDDTTAEGYRKGICSSDWWLRSANGYFNDEFWCVHRFGDVDSSRADGSRVVVPTFVIG